MELYKKYSIKPIIIIITLWIMMSGSTLIYFYRKDSFFHFGPSKEKYMDTWSKWSLLMSYSFVSPFINSLVNSTLHPFMLNVIRDHKTPWEDLRRNAYIITLVYKIYYWFNDICDILIIFTLQFQFYLPSLMAEIIVGIATTRKYILEK